MKSTHLFLIKIAGFMILMCSALTASSAESYKLGVNAPRSTQETQNQWQDLGKYLRKTTGKQGSVFGGVVVVKKGGAISKKDDLKGKLVSALSMQSVGGYLFQDYHLFKKVCS